MATLYRRSFTRREIAQRAGMLSQFAGVRLMTLEDGVERGIRMLEFRTGSGLRFTVLVDRAFDIADCEYCGAAIGWHSPAGFRHPGLHEYEGEGGLAWLRSFSGLLVTCGLDHILFMNSDSAEHYHYRPRKSVDSSIHGRISTIPGRLLSYGENWDGDECTLYCEGIVQQSTVFGEDLHLSRRIEAKVGASEFTIYDRVINHGFYRTPHMYCYHINIGHPVLDEGSRYIAPIREVTWAAHAETYKAQAVGYTSASKPQHNFHEQVWEHWLAADSNGKVPFGVVNERFNGGQGLGILIEVNKDEFPCHFEWQNFQEGQYVIGVEPSTNHVLGKPFAKKRDELIWLEHAAERSYGTRFEFLGDVKAIQQVEKRIRAIAEQPTEDYPTPTDNWEPLR
ncbi:MAG: aldose 1-epimerase family protein [Verrucomicrobia bacterium]|nr:aldose 1-epimerase family protein [Verrucomicrobiota bacterium]